MWWIGAAAAGIIATLGFVLYRAAARADQALEAYRRHVGEIRANPEQWRKRREDGLIQTIPPAPEGLAHGIYKTFTPSDISPEMADQIEAGTFRPAFGVFVPTAEPEPAIDYCLCEHEFEDHDIFGACTVWDCNCTAWEDDGGERAERLAAEEG